MHKESECKSYCLATSKKYEFSESVKLRTIYVKIKSHYGTDRVYPDCPVSAIFAEMTGTKTFCHNDLRRIRSLGYKIEVRKLDKSSTIIIGE